MSAPPKTVLKYSGLVGYSGSKNPGRISESGSPSVVGINYRSAGIFGIPIQFFLAASFANNTPVEILDALGEICEVDPAGQLARLINRRADELPLPDGCAAISGIKNAIRIWEDPLSALAIISKCSGSVWLRTKTPAIHAAVAKRTVTLLVPPKFAACIPELQQHGLSASPTQIDISIKKIPES